MKKIALISCALLLVGCSAPSPDTTNISAHQTTATAPASPSSRTAIEVSDTETCQSLLGTGGELVSESAQFLTDLSELSDETVAEAATQADALRKVADTASEQLRAPLTVMQEPFHELANSYKERKKFNLVAEPFKAAASEIIATCEPLIKASAAAEAKATADAEASSKAESEAEAAASATAKSEAEASAKAEAAASAKAEAAASATAKAEAETAARTLSQQNALRAAKDYLDYSAFSRTSLVSQLEYEKYSTADATWAVDHVTVDWNKQAAKAAKDYLDYSAFSRSGLIDQLAYEGFTPEQAEYGVSQTGL